jgi:hypothetical protein
MQFLATVDSLLTENDVKPDKPTIKPALRMAEGKTAAARKLKVVANRRLDLG